MIEPNYFAEFTISARQRFHQAEFIDRIVEDTKVSLCIKLSELPYRKFTAEWMYFGHHPVQVTHNRQFANWKDIPEGHDIIIRLRVEQLA